MHKKIYHTSIYRQYIKSIRSLPRLCESELSSLIEVYRLTQSIHARNKIIEHFLPLIPQVIDSYSHHICIDKLDLIQTANLILINVIHTNLLNTDIHNLPAYIVRSVSNDIMKYIEKEQRIQGIIKSQQ